MAAPVEVPVVPMDPADPAPVVPFLSCQKNIITNNSQREY
jgi:hypothetical protein